MGLVGTVLPSAVAHAGAGERERTASGSSSTPAADASPSSPMPKLPPLFSRFQNLLPHPELRPDPSLARAHNDAVLSADEATAADALNPDGHEFLKIRFLTWNMHESLPKGDLTPLLGAVPAYVAPSQEELASGRLPQVPLGEDDTPTYHLVVISGQETPTPSGIPLGLAAVKWGAGQSHTSTPSVASQSQSPLAQPPASPKAPSRITAATHPSPQSSTDSRFPPADKANAPESDRPAPEAEKKPADLSRASLAPPPSFSLSSSTPPASPKSDAPSPPTPTPASAAPASPSRPSNLSLQIPNGARSGSSGGTSRSASPTSSSPSGGDGAANPPAPKLSLGDVGLPDCNPKPHTQFDSALPEIKADLFKDAKEPTKAALQVQPRVSDPKGWSELLEDWFCNRAGEPSQRVPQGAPDASDAEEESGTAPAAEPTHAASKARLVEEGQGAYQLVRKERMLGIYLAVFVWKGAAHLLASTSSSYVTTGLIGGRWGNKGGVAISVKLAKKRLLFINSHLAAHASRSDVRLLNVAKIKSELSIDAFLEAGDHRSLLEDPTDRFDSTFWCGDLNFRLDVSRLHADWLMSRKAYQEAFQFDQLRKIMEEKRGFEGFKEAPINFAPTYKFDILRKETVKRSLTKSSSTRRRKNKSLTEVQENGVAEEADDDGQEVDSSSIISAGWTSVGQQSDYHSEADEADLADNDEVPEPASLQQQSRMLAGKMVSESKKLFLPSTVLKGKRKILNLIKPPPSSPSTATPSWAEKRSGPASLPSTTGFYDSHSASAASLDLDWSERKRSTEIAREQSTNSYTSNASSSYGGAGGPTYSTSPPALKSLDIGGAGGGSGSPPRPALSRQLSSKLRRSFSGKLDLGARDVASDDDTDDENAAPSTSIRASGLTANTYDSSSKARVPSWCDRILFKTFESNYPPRTPPAEPERPDGPHPSRLDRFTSALNLRKPGRLSRSVSASSQLSKASNGTAGVERGPYFPASSSPTPSQVSLHDPTPDEATTPTSALAPALPPLAGRGARVHWSTGSSQVDGDAPTSSASPSRRSSLSRYVLRQRSNSLSLSSEDAASARSKGKGKAALPHLDLHVDTDLRRPHRSLTAPATGESPSSAASLRGSASAHDRPGLAEARHISAPPTTTSWFSRLLTSFAHASGSGSNDDLPAAAAAASSSPKVVRKRGEILPLRYGTLNDQEMSVLKGCSDHRPVIGVFAIFI